MSIAMALKKKGIDPPPMPKLEPKEPATVEAPATGKNRNKKQRRRDQERKELKKVIVSTFKGFPRKLNIHHSRTENQSSRSDSGWATGWRTGTSSS